MSKGNPQAGGSTSGFGSQGQFGQGYAGGSYDPMLGFGQSSGMGTSFDYPTRYSADYTRYAQSGMPFNQPVMGYNTYGQIFSQPRPQPPSFGGKGGGGFQPQPPAGGGKGRVGTPRVPRGGTGNFLDFYTRQNNPANSIFEPGSQPPVMGGKGGGGFGNQSGGDFGNQFGGFGNQFGGGFGNPYGGFQGGFGNQFGGFGNQFGGFGNQFGGFGNQQRMFRQPERRTRQLGLNNPPQQEQPVYAGGSPYNSNLNKINQEMPSYLENPSLFVTPAPEDASRNAIGQPLTQEFRLFTGGFGNNVPEPMPGGGLGGMLAGRSQDPNSRVMGERNFDMQGFNLPPQSFDFGQGFGRLAFQEGGQVPPDAAANMEMMLAEAPPANPQAEMAGEYDRLIQMTMQAILGQVESPDEIIQMFIDEFGVDAFRQLRDAVLKQQVPGAQTEGMVNGNGGGMDDQVMGMIGNQRPVAVSPGEYIVPADVVSGLGDGSSKSGADILDELNQAVRMARTGTTEQPRPLMETMQQ